jgi:membrane protein YqaA with SNARE-associated domain
MTGIFLFAFLAVLPLTLLYREGIVSFGEGLLSKYSNTVAYLILLLLTAISSTIIPLPVWAYVGAAISMGLNVYMVSIISGLGTTLGSCSTYVLGRYFSHVEWVRKKLYSDEEKMAKVRSKLSRYGLVALFFVALTPFPADPYYFACGLLRLPLATYAPVVFTGRTSRYLIMSICIEGAI